MKKYLLFLFTIVILSSCGVSKSVISSLDAQMASLQGQYQVSDNGVYVQKVIEAKGTKDELYVQLLEFLTRTYNDANSVIQVREKENGLIVCKGCHKFHVNEILYGSAVEQTAWHIYKAEVKEGKVRVTITLDDISYYCPPSYINGVSISAKSGNYSILECPPFKKYDNKNDQVKQGYVFYHAVSNIVDLMNATEKALIDKPTYQVDENW